MIRNEMVWLDRVHSNKGSPEVQGDSWHTAGDVDLCAAVPGSSNNYTLCVERADPLTIKGICTERDANGVDSPVIAGRRGRIEVCVGVTPDRVNLVFVNEKPRNSASCVASRKSGCRQFFNYGIEETPTPRPSSSAPLLHLYCWG
jgi:hypothetical protein